MGSLGDSLIPSEIFPGVNKSAPVVSIIRSINNLDQVEIKEKWLDLTQCELTFENLPMCLWGKDFAQLTVNNVNHKISNDVPLILSDLEERKDIYCKLFFKNLPQKDYTIKPLIRGDIELFFEPEPKFKIDANKHCGYRIIDQYQKEITFETKRDNDAVTIIPTIQQYEMLEVTSEWELEVMINSNKAYSRKFQIEPPPLSFFELNLIDDNLIIEGNSNIGFFATFQCSGYPPSKKSFSGHFIDQNGGEFNALVENGKGRIIFKMEDFDFSFGGDFYSFSGSLKFDIFNKKFDDINMKMRDEIYVKFSDKLVDDKGYGPLFEYRNTKWPVQINISLDNEQTSEKKLINSNKKITINLNSDSSLIRQQTEKFEIQSLKEHFPEINEIFLEAESINVNVELVAFGNEEFGVKQHSILLSRRDIRIRRKYQYKEHSQESWEFYLARQYIADSSKLILVYAKENYSPYHIEGNTYSFQITHPSYTDIIQGHDWKLNYDGITILEGDVEIPKIEFKKSYSEDIAYIVLNQKEESFSFFELGELASDLDKEIVGNFSLDLVLKFKDEPGDILITLNDVEVGEKIQISREEFDSSTKSRLLQICKKSNDGEKIGTISLVIPQRDNMELIKSDSIVFAKSTGATILSKYEDWLFEEWDGSTGHIRQNYSSELDLNRTYLILALDLYKVFDPFRKQFEGGTWRRDWLKNVEMALNNTNYGSKIFRQTTKITIDYEGWEYYKQWYGIWKAWYSEFKNDELYKIIKDRISQKRHLDKGSGDEKKKLDEPIKITESLQETKESNFTVTKRKARLIGKSKKQDAKIGKKSPKDDPKVWRENNNKKWKERLENQNVNNKNSNKVENPETGKTQAVDDKTVENEVPTPKKRKSNSRKNIVAFRGRRGGQN